MSKRIILVGKAGSGKDYMRDKFTEAGFVPDISVTTRPMRDGEEPGVAYHFISDEVFEDMSKAGGLYEEVQFNGWKYGTILSSWENSDVFIFTPSGVAQISPEERKNCVVFYIDIDEEVRRERLEKRSDADRVERRLKADEKDFKDFTDYDIRITNPRF